MTALSFEKSKSDDENDSGHERSHNRRMGKAEACRFNQTPDQRAETEGDDNCSQPIKTPFFVAGTFRNAPVANDDDDDGERKIDEEDRAPGNLLDQPATEDRSDSGSDCAKARPGADSASAIFLAKGAANDGETAWYEQRSAKSLARAGENQRADSGSETAPRRSRGEDDHADNENASSPVSIA